MRSQPDVLVIGGGVIGLTTAYYLARDGATVHVVDRTAPGTEASWAGAGIIPPGNPDRAATPYDRLRGASSRLYPGLSAELRELTGIDNGYRVCGGIEAFDRPAPQVTGLWHSEGIEFSPVDPDQLQNLEPHVRIPAPEVYHLPGMAQVRNPWHVRALVAACERLGVVVEANVAVGRFRTAGVRVLAALAAAGRDLFADRYLITSGAWSRHLAGQLGLPVAIHPVLGQIALFHPPARLFRRILCLEKQYLVPREDGRILVGSTEEPEAGFEKRTTEAGISGLTRFAAGIVPALAGLAPENAWAGLRPGSPDGMPFLGRIPGWENAFIAAGHYRAGIQLSPATGRLMADVLTDRTPRLPIDTFRPDRPPSPRVPTAFRS